jgi:hypothetical protein
VAEKCTVIELPGPTGRTINHHHLVSHFSFLDLFLDILDFRLKFLDKNNF